LSRDSETIRWPTNLDRAAIEKRLLQVAAKAEHAGLPELAQRFSGVATASAAQIASHVVASLTWLANQPHESREKYDDLARDLEMVALNLKNLK
jgi:hypothetical protein